MYDEHQRKVRGTDVRQSPYALLIHYQEVQVWVRLYEQNHASFLD